MSSSPSGRKWLASLKIFGDDDKDLLWRMVSFNNDALARELLEIMSTIDRALSLGQAPHAEPGPAPSVQEGINEQKAFKTMIAALENTKKALALADFIIQADPKALNKVLNTPAELSGRLQSVQKVVQVAKASAEDWWREDLLNDPQTRAARAEQGRLEENLLLYWPPLDANDPERKGEDLLWVGAKGAGVRLWNYLCAYMDRGMDGVVFPPPDTWLRKGFSDASEHLEESVMQRSHQIDDAMGQGTSAGTYLNYALNMPAAPVNSLAEWLFCSWPTFPEEWNSDCGQKRRESGIGPEEPLHWQAFNRVA